MVKSYFSAVEQDDGDGALIVADDKIKWIAPPGVYALAKNDEQQIQRSN